MDWNACIDSYCERLLPGFWGEPLNAAAARRFGWPPGGSGGAGSVPVAHPPPIMSKPLTNTPVASSLAAGTSRPAGHAAADRRGQFCLSYLCHALGCCPGCDVHSDLPSLLPGGVLALWWEMALDLYLTRDAAVFVVSWGLSMFWTLWLPGTAAYYLAAWTILTVLCAHSAWKEQPSRRPGRSCDLFCNQFEPAPARHAAVQRLALGNTLCRAFVECRHAGADHLSDGAVTLNFRCKNRISI